MDVSGRVIWITSWQAEGEGSLEMDFFRKMRVVRLRFPLPPPLETDAVVDSPPTWVDINKG